MKDIKLSIVVCGMLLSVCAHAQIDFAKRDAAMRHGTIYYREVDRRGKDTKEVKLAYSSDGSYLERAVNAPPSSVKSVVFWKCKDGQLMETKTNGSDEIRFDSSLPRNDSPMFFITNKPSLPLLGGFASFSKVKEGHSIGSTTVTATMHDHTDLAAKFTSMASKGIPDFIERSSRRGRAAIVLNRFDFQGSVPTSQGIWVPATIHYTVPTVHPDIFERLFEIHSADFSEPSAADLDFNWFHPGITVLDDRFVPPIIWSYDAIVAANGGKKELSLKQYNALANARWKSIRPHPISGRRRRSPLKIFISCLIVLGAFIGMVCLIRRSRVN